VRACPLERVRCFFETTQEHYRHEGYMGCLLGGLGQELSRSTPLYLKNRQQQVLGGNKTIFERIGFLMGNIQDPY